MNLFNIPANDQSIAILTKIYGTVGAVLPAAKGGPLILGTLFKTFNTIMLTLGALVIVYTTVVGLLATAHEGEFMGKKWSGLWVPIRSLIGITALFPTASGYSVLQVIIMWVILQGIGAADMVWTSALNYTQISGSPLSQPTFPNAGMEGQMTALFQGLTCQANSLLKTKYEDPYKLFYYCSKVPTSTYCKQTNENLWKIAERSKTDGTNYVYKMGPAGNCGSIAYCDPKPYCDQGKQASIPDQIKCVACKAQQTALTQIVPILGAVAVKFTDVDSQYVDFFLSESADRTTPDLINKFCQDQNIKECCIWKWAKGPYGMLIPIPCPNAGSFPSWKISDEEWTSPGDSAVKQIMFPFGMQDYLSGVKFTDAAVGYYTSAVTGALATYIQTLPPASLRDWRKTAQEHGWVVAGSFYNRIADFQSDYLDSARPNFTVTLNLDPKNNPMTKYRNDVQAANFLVNQFQESGGGTPSPEMNRLSNDLENTASGIFNNWRESLQPSVSGTKNPLAELHLFGKRLLIVAELFYPIILSAAVIAGASNISFIALGTGPISPASWLGYLIVIGFLPMAFFFLGFCFTFGGMLAVYVPLIPYIIFTLTALGWFISTVEAMVASPLIALGILSPGGQHEILGRSEPALMLLLGVLLRPTLMIFGLMAAMLLSYAALLFVNNTFGMVMGDITKRPSITELILFCAAYTFIIISVLNKCFSLIHLIPERVMTWIGGQAVSYGEGEGLGEVKRGSEGAGQGAAGMAKGAGEHVKGGLTAKAKRDAKNEAGAS